MNRIVHTVLRSERLTLRPPVLADAEDGERYVSDRRVAEMTSLIPHPYPRGASLEWIERTARDWTEGTRAAFMICLRDSGELVGSISVFSEPADGNLIGYWIGVPHWGRGYATEALKRVIRYAFEDLAVERITTYHFAHNPASGRVMQKAGLKFKGLTPLGASRGDKRYDDVRYAIEASEWRAQPALVP